MLFAWTNLVTKDEELKICLSEVRALALSTINGIFFLSLLPSLLEKLSFSFHKNEKKKMV
jgi:hypothetical protein